MQLRSLTSVTALLALVVSAMAAPRNITPRQYYDGPCSPSNCGASGRVCSSGYLCVRYPSISAPEGCTCSAG
ncbi:hypothetical protein F5X99DRAFT_399880 [Biscogniauxia marginata]|nr:hypothetical protein F5X99DRAFT_399880 [Biscogniauxia marginata]